MKALIECGHARASPKGYPDVFNDAWREQATNTTISRMLQRLVVDNWDARQGVCGDAGRA